MHSTLSGPPFTPRNGRPVDLQLPAINDARDIVAAMAAITNAVNDGSLTAEEADHLVHVLDGYVKALDDA